MNPTTSKVSGDHLRRDAYLYVRQSSLHQVMQNRESTKRQYALQQRAVALGWPADRVVVIDSDLGQSAAAGTTTRAGFQRLVAEVGMGRAGVVLGLEVSRLARSSTEWHRLLEICALTHTLIMDEDGIYDPAHFNDRLLLGLKGTMSEAELHVLRARLQGGILNKARRGELKMGLPVGLVYDASDRVVLDPDQRIRHAIEHFFETFRRVGSATGVMNHFRDNELLFPLRLRTGPRKGEVVFQPLRHARAIRMLHNPRYAGAFAYGRTRTRPKPEGGVRIQTLPREEWQVLIPDVHEGYITWTEYEANVRRLRLNAQARGQDRHQSPPREGPALLQGMVVCGLCGDRMTTQYQARPDGTKRVRYVCQLGRLQWGDPACQNVLGSELDQTIGELLVEVMTPLSLEVALSVGDELRARAEEVDRLRREDLEQARYEADLAERRYRRVDPDHRLVADALEADWNEKLRAFAEAQEHYERKRAAEEEGLDEEGRAEIVRLATDFPRLWSDPHTPHREKKRMARLMIEDVTLIRGDEITAHVRFKGGATRTLTLPLPLRAADLRRTDPAVVQRVDQLLDEHVEEEIPDLLNAEGHRTGTGLPFTLARVRDLCVRNKLRNRYARLRDKGLWTVGEMAEYLGVARSTVQRWYAAGLLKAQHCGSGRSKRLYEPPGPNPPRPRQGKKLVQATPQP
ncbi:MAG: recombinase family protein [Longimicrobiales bacterium]